MIPVLGMCVSLFVLIIPSIILYKLYWIPLRLQRLMESQGIRGPAYRFFHGTTKEVIKMEQQTNDAAVHLLDHDIFPIIQPHFYTWTKLYGNNFLHWIGTEPEIVITEAELIKQILTNKQRTFPKITAKSYFMKLLGDGLVVAQGEKWAKLRKLSNHAFHGECLKDMVPAMISCVETMLEKWRTHHGKEIEVFSEFKQLSSDVISRTAFGSSYLEGRKIFEMLSKLGILIFRNRLSIRFFGLGKFITTQQDMEADKTEQLLHDSIMEIVNKRQLEVPSAKADSFGSDFLGSLLRSHHDTNPKNQISAAEIIDECKTFFFAGQETTSSLLTWATFLLATHTEWQETAREEVLQLFGKQNLLNSDGLARLKIVNMILYETLRLYSPVTLILRRTGSRVKLGKYKLPANVRVVIPPLALHRNPDIWGRNAHLFQPERFAQGLAKATNGNPTGFLGFGFGPRTCVGLNLAISEAKITLSMILQRYKFTLSSDYVHSPYIYLSVRPQRGVGILLQPL